MISLTAPWSMRGSQMTWVAPNIFRVSVAGAPVGHGYVFDDYCHYHLETGKAFVEASYRVGAERSKCSD